MLLTDILLSFLKDLSMPFLYAKYAIISFRYVLQKTCIKQMEI